MFGSRSTAKKMFVSVGSASNVNDRIPRPAEKNRAGVWSSIRTVQDASVCYGIRTAWDAVQFQDRRAMVLGQRTRRAGDNLVPDYITHVQEGGFYGGRGGIWQPIRIPDTRGSILIEGKRSSTPEYPEPHNASLGHHFLRWQQFPRNIMEILFASNMGPGNRAVRVGYELIRVPLHQTAMPAGNIRFHDRIRGRQ